MNYTAAYSTKSTPQTEPIPGSAQVENSAGGFVFAVDDWTRLDRFLILGNEGGSYYATERKMTVENAEAVLRCLTNDGPRAVARIVEISEAGRAPKNDPAIFALALALKLGSPAARSAAKAAVPKVCRTGTHIFQLAQAVDALGGWGRGTKAAFENWYRNNFNPYQAVKYQSRNGWSHRDLLRKLHLTPRTPDEQVLYRWAAGKPVDVDLPEIIWASELAKVFTDPEAVAGLIWDYNLPREAIPTQFLNNVDVWMALLQNMPLTALVRNLGKMSSVGLLTSLSEASKLVVAKLSDREAIRASRLHPIAILNAYSTYAQGKGLKGSNTWEPVQAVTAALNEAFYLAFDNVTPSGKRHLLSLDVSGSMDGANIAGTALTARTASVAMALVTARTEPQHMLAAFATSYAPIRGIDSKVALGDAIRFMQRIPMGATDCALPMIAAAKDKVPVDVFTIYTDSETFAGRIHPKQALDQYRQTMGIPAKLVVVGMVSNGFSIADPKDAGMLDCVGFDTSAPAVISEFAND